MKREKDISSLEHTAWRCQYHVVFAPKYRRMEIYGQIKQDIGVILRKLCQQKRVEISRDNRSAGVSGSYPYAYQYTSKVQCIADHGRSERKEQSDDIRQTREFEV